MNVRRFVRSDRASLEEAINAVCAEGRWMSTSSFQPTPAWRHALEQPNCSNHCLLVAEEKGHIVGWCRVLPAACKGEVTKAELGIGLLPDYRNRGLGTVLVQRVLDWARETGLERLWLRTREDNTRARRVFARCGFFACGKSDGWIRMIRQLQSVSREA